MKGQLTSVELKYASLNYTGKKRTQSKATVIIKGTGSYTGTLKRTFRIVPTKRAFRSITAGVKKITLKWTKKKVQATGYRYEYSTVSSFKTRVRKTAVIANEKKATITKTIMGLKSGKTYYVRIRAYKVVDGKKYYGGWSEAVKVKVK